MTRRLSSDDPCRCGHPHLAHEHYRKGTDCALCVCDSFAFAPLTARKGSRLFRRPPSVVA